MKKLKFSLLIGILLMLCTFSACSQKVFIRSEVEVSTSENPETKPSIVLNVTYEELIPGEAFRLIPLVRPIQQYTPEYQFSTSDPEIAEVDETGLVTAKSLGRCVIEVTTAGMILSSSCTVNVVGQHPPVETPTLEPSSQEPTVTPSWSSTTTEEPTSPDTSESPREVIPIERIEITCPRYVYMGSTYTLTAKVYPENATETFSFYCSDERYVQFEKEGGATFTVKKNDGVRVLFWAECNQSDIKSENVEAVLAYPLSVVNADTNAKYTNYSTYSVTVNDVLNLKLQIFTENQEPESIRWYNLESMGGGINISITTDEETNKNCTVTVQNAGKAGINIWVRIQGEDYLYAILFNVQEAPRQEDKPSIELPQAEITLETGNIAAIGATLLNSEGTLTYKSDNVSVASVSADGQIRANAEGTANIIISLEGSELTVTLKVTVIASSEPSPEPSPEPTPEPTTPPSGELTSAQGASPVPSL